MPLSAFDLLVTLNIEYPMLFKIKNHSGERASHCSVLEFTADEGTVLLPQWMLQNLLLQEGGIVEIENVFLLKGGFVKLQPHTKDFLNICNPKEFLENALRAYACLTTGDTIALTYDNKKYYIDIVETQPSNAISIIETDCEVDFALPLDYEEPKKPLKKPEATTVDNIPIVQEKDDKAKPDILPSMGRGRRPDGKPSMLWETCHECFEGMGPTLGASTTVTSGNTCERPKVFSSQQAEEEEKPEFSAFTGKKYILGSKVGPSVCIEENGESDYSMLSDEEMESEICASVSKGKGKCLQEELSESWISSTSTCSCSEKNAVSSNLQAQKEEEPKFKPFTENKCTPVQEQYEKVEPAISPFMGRGRRLDGKPSLLAVESTSTPSPQLVSDFNTSHIPNTKERINKVLSTMRAQREEEPEFEPFTGKGYMLGSS